MISSLIAIIIFTTLAAGVSKCPTEKGVGIIVARASGEAPGTGIIGAVAQNVLAQLPGSTVSAVDYPATLANYTDSEAYGTGNMTLLLQDFVAKCPQSKVVLMGYSQGAQVTADTLCGTSEMPFRKTPAQPTFIAEAVAAVVLMGDPSHAVAAPWNVGTSTKDGVFPRQDLESCRPVADKMVSYCDTNDKYCDSGNSSAVHRSYVKVYGVSAVDFIMKKLAA